ncbi:hypothetical protein [Actinoplanes derwentensis]|uniref:Uncharacterized protein n=1 Tax=Actinoplanes derwentensis TaxID=113562 RepID=A0A1H2DEI0_9ACTN|nr:hypothetical protein [Actinoplanes derwentensis]GID84759.1 hypothetical protein Ade03nite_36830 [Actinoplanes derwentensis]SDT81158.1 hypothetical protein SAMN04489716_9519 [Actinoplanes derwentensis]
MSKLIQLPVPVRNDRWKPSNPLLESVIRKYIDEARNEVCDTTGSAGTLVGGGMVLVALGIILSAGSGNPLLAVMVVVALALGGLAYTGVKAPPLRPDPLQILAPMGGPGNLPAGYLVHPLAWQAGLPHYLAGIPERRLRIAVDLCRDHPGAVTDLLRLVERAERHVAEHKPGRDFSPAGRLHEVQKFATRMVEYQVRRVPALTQG